MLSSTMKADLIVVDEFYEDPDSVRNWALSQKYYRPWSDQMSGWLTTYWSPSRECPFKSSEPLQQRLEQVIGESIDRDHWNLDFPVDDQRKPLPNLGTTSRSCLWNAGFQVKLITHELGTGVHNHVTDEWNNVGENGWAGIIYLNPNAPISSGLNLWRNRFGSPNEWMSDKSRWEQLDSIGNIYNRLVLVRGFVPHSGGSGFGDGIESGRLFQTFFFKTKAVQRFQSLKRNEIALFSK